MKMKKRVQKLIEENFCPKESYEDDELEIDNLCKGKIFLIVIIYRILA